MICVKVVIKDTIPTIIRPRRDDEPSPRDLCSHRISSEEQFSTMADERRLTSVAFGHSHVPHVPFTQGR